MRVFRIILPVTAIEQAAGFYSALLAQPGKRVSAGWHYFDLGQMVLACHEPAAEGDAATAPSLSQPVHFAVHDLEGFHSRAQAAGAVTASGIETRPWGERSFYCRDPFGNPLCFVEAGTEFTG
ncbi:VOC family protein [Niveispirillum sp.]|uniref:VOC family protein n=1 Tax=Niveispirillum sp. TaxID=1917217 RepID=UPI001B4B5EE4|nr:VOC family protein [Niveispirillum sp.]MBP7336363.1 VOC family protein [Niveispirillum sp.]